MADFPAPGAFGDQVVSPTEQAKANNNRHRARRVRWTPKLDGGEHIALIAVRKTTAWAPGDLETLATAMESQYGGQGVDLVKGIADGTAPEAVDVAPDHDLRLRVEAGFLETPTPPTP